MNTRRRSGSSLLTIPFLMLVSAAVLLGQAQPQTKAQTQPQTKAQTQPQTKAQTQPQTKAQTQQQTKAQTQPQTKAQTQQQTKAQTQPQIKAKTQQPIQQTQQAIPKKIKKSEKLTTQGKSLSGQCQAITKNGTRCSRKALPGSKYCREHGGK